MVKTSQPIMVQLSIEGKSLPMELDTGATFSVISDMTYKCTLAELKLHKSKIFIEDLHRRAYSRSRRAQRPRMSWRPTCFTSAVGCGRRWTYPTWKKLTYGWTGKQFTLFPKHKHRTSLPISYANITLYFSKD